MVLCLKIDDMGQGLGRTFWVSQPSPMSWGAQV